MQSPSIDLKSVARSQWLKQHEQGSPTDVFAELFEEVPPTLLENELEVEAAVSSITAAIAREEAAEAAERHEIARAKEREAAWLEEWRQEAQAAKEKEKRELEEWKRQAQAAKAAEKAALRAEIESAKARVVASRRAERSGIPQLLPGHELEPPAPRDPSVRTVVACNAVVLRLRPPQVTRNMVPWFPCH